METLKQLATAMGEAMIQTIDFSLTAYLVQRAAKETDEIMTQPYNLDDFRDEMIRCISKSRKIASTHGGLSIERQPPIDLKVEWHRLHQEYLTRPTSSLMQDAGISFIGMKQCVISLGDDGDWVSVCTGGEGVLDISDEKPYQVMLKIAGLPDGKSDVCAAITLNDPRSPYVDEIGLRNGDPRGPMTEYNFAYLLAACIIYKCGAQQERLLDISEVEPIDRDKALATLRRSVLTPNGVKRIEATDEPDDLSDDIWTMFG